MTGNPVTNALVDGTFTGDFSETINNVTINGSGEAVFTTAGCVKGPDYEFCVVDVTGFFTYDPNSNVETCGTN